MTQTGELRNDGNYRRYLVARIVNMLGDQIYLFAISWFVLDLTKSSLNMAGLLAVNALAVTAVAPLGGLIADRLSRKTVMVITDLVQGAVLAGLLALARENLLTVGALYAGTAVLGACAALFTPASSAIVPGIVRRELVPAAVAAGQAAANFCTIAGMLLGGVMYSLVGISGVLLLNGLSFFIAAGVEAGLRTGAAAGAEPQVLPAGSLRAAGRPPGRRPADALREIRDGLRHVRSDRQVFGLLLVNTAFNLVALPIAMVYMPFLFNVVLHATASQAAFPQASVWAGIMLGSAAVSRVQRRARPEPLIAGGLLAIGVHALLMVGLVSVGLSLGARVMSGACSLANAVAGAACGFFTIPMYALFHARTVDEFRGRFWGMEGALRTGATCAGFFIAGAIAQRLPLGVIFAGTGIVMAMLSVAVLRLRGSPKPGLA